ncbi:MAG: arginine repressor, partial [Faecalimonas sp.]|nr:arginine repressor [Faecalimonas sp.]
MKVNRHAKIVELVNQYQIETQEELAERLNAEGYKVTQATVSRDIRDLKLTKVPAENGKQKYAVLKTTQSELMEKYLRILKDGFV